MEALFSPRDTSERVDEVGKRITLLPLPVSSKKAQVGEPALFLSCMLLDV